MALVRAKNKRNYSVTKAGHKFKARQERTVEVVGYNVRQLTASESFETEVLEAHPGDPQYIHRLVAAQKGEEEEAGGGEQTQEITEPQGEGGYEVVEVPAGDEETEEVVEVEATEAAIKLAAELGIDLGTVEGSGADGRIIKADVEALA